MMIAEFLLAGIDDDEAVAALPTGRVYGDNEGVVSTPVDEWADGSDRLPNRHTVWSLLHDPARMLAECEAKRRIVAEHADDGGHCATCGSENGWTGDGEGGEWFDGNRSPVEFPCLTLCALATVYADREGYREEWRP